MGGTSYHGTTVLRERASAVKTIDHHHHTTTTCALSMACPMLASCCAVAAVTLIPQLVHYCRHGQPSEECHQIAQVGISRVAVGRCQLEEGEIDQHARHDRARDVYPVLRRVGLLLRPRGGDRVFSETGRVEWPRASERQ